MSIEQSAFEPELISSATFPSQLTTKCEKRCKTEIWGKAGEEAPQIPAAKELFTRCLEKLL